jgi:hypothetical protein
MTTPRKDRRLEEPLREEDSCNPDCKAVFVLERRVNSHAAELIALKEMIKTNNAQTKEILDIVGLGRAFFKVLGWIGSAIKPIVAIVAIIAAVITWIKTGVLK